MPISLPVALAYPESVPFMAGLCGGVRAGDGESAREDMLTGVVKYLFRPCRKVRLSSLVIVAWNRKEKEQKK